MTRRTLRGDAGSGLASIGDREGFVSSIFDREGFTPGLRVFEADPDAKADPPVQTGTDAGSSPDPGGLTLGPSTAVGFDARLETSFAFEDWRAGAPAAAAMGGASSGATSAAQIAEIQAGVSDTEQAFVTAAVSGLVQGGMAAAAGTATPSFASFRDPQEAYATEPAPLGGPDDDDDSDGLTNAQEARLGTDSLNPDSDDDGFADGVEARRGGDPATWTPPNATADDADGDGLTKAQEAALGTSDSAPISAIAGMSDADYARQRYELQKTGDPASDGELRARFGIASTPAEDAAASAGGAASAGAAASGSAAHRYETDPTSSTGSAPGAEGASPSAGGAKAAATPAGGAAAAAEEAAPAAGAAASADAAASAGGAKAAAASTGSASSAGGAAAAAATEAPGDAAAAAGPPSGAAASVAVETAGGGGRAADDASRTAAAAPPSGAAAPVGVDPTGGAGATGDSGAGLATDGQIIADDSGGAPDETGGLRETRTPPPAEGTQTSAPSSSGDVDDPTAGASAAHEPAPVGGFGGPDARARLADDFSTSIMGGLTAPVETSGIHAAPASAMDNAPVLHYIDNTIAWGDTTFAPAPVVSEAETAPVEVAMVEAVPVEAAAVAIEAAQMDQPAIDERLHEPDPDPDPPADQSAAEAEIMAALNQASDALRETMDVASLD
jgi:hypothetical protein